MNMLFRNHAVLPHFSREPSSPITEITYVGTAEGWLHLAAILDLFSRGVGRLEGASSRLPEDVSVLTLASARMINV